VGLDLGQVADYTAIAVLERPPVPTDAPPYKPPVYALRHLERLPLGTSYPDVVAAVGDLMGRLPRRGPLVADATGVGRPVIDLLRAAGLDPIPVVVHGGDQTTVVEGYRRVPKRELVAVAQVLLQQRRLRVARSLPLVKALVEELQTFEVKISDTGHDSYGVWREGKHDDLVFATALACWYAARVAAVDEWLTRNPTQVYGVSITATPTHTSQEAALAATRDRFDAWAKRGAQTRVGTR